MNVVTLNPTMPSSHGGKRRGAGRKSIFGTKLKEKAFAMDFTPEGRRALDALVRRTGLSRNAVVALLALQHAEQLVFAPDARPFPDKAGHVLSIRVPGDAAVKLRAARVRTKRSYSDLGEALVRWYGATSSFPPRP